MAENDNNPQQKKSFLARATAALGYLRHVLSRFATDQCPQRAAALTYTTLLAMVPLLAISFASETGLTAAVAQLKGRLSDKLNTLYDALVQVLVEEVRTQIRLADEQPLMVGVADVLRQQRLDRHSPFHHQMLVKE
ncbi:MAG: hypothetical protein ABFS02_14750 [Pseudomonadota bacterium]